MSLREQKLTTSLVVLAFHLFVYGMDDTQTTLCIEILDGLMEGLELLEIHSSPILPMKEDAIDIAEVLLQAVALLEPLFPEEDQAAITEKFQGILSLLRT